MDLAAFLVETKLYIPPCATWDTDSSLQYSCFPMDTDFQNRMSISFIQLYIHIELFFF